MYSAGASLSLFTRYTPWYNIAAHNLAMVMIAPAKCQYVVSVPSSALGNALERLLLGGHRGDRGGGAEATQVKGEDQRGGWRGGRSCDSTGSFHVVFLRHRRRGVWCGGASTDKPATPLAPATPATPAILDPAALSAALSPAALPPSSPYPKSCILNP